MNSYLKKLSKLLLKQDSLFIVKTWNTGLCICCRSAIEATVNNPWIEDNQHTVPTLNSFFQSAPTFLMTRNMVFQPVSNCQSVFVAICNKDFPSITLEPIWVSLPHSLYIRITKKKTLQCHHSSIFIHRVLLEQNSVSETSKSPNFLSPSSPYCQSIFPKP